ncbi:Phosphoenolpyruvate synthase [hydrothermal vent metagenome]|uniref:pyruvate, water dikinase n=1 Tax=hydrothermal vent metagenome TaxID=652676 RepID=A0A3B0WKR2_9ZZZZ
MSKKYIQWFEELAIEDIPQVGGKNASLGEMYQLLTPQGIRVPNGFATTSQAYWLMLDQNNALNNLQKALDGLDPNDVNDLAERGAKARDIIYGVGLPNILRQQILSAFHQLKSQYSGKVSVAVRSSATAEDLPKASFAGQQDTFLNIESDEQLLDACRRCFASLFTDRAIHYRIDKGFDHFKVALSIGIMKMVRSDQSASGVMFSLDTETGFRDVVFITGAYGLGENIVQGAVEPDEFYVHKPTFEQGYRAILKRTLGSKKIQMQYASGCTRSTTQNVPTPKVDRQKFCITDEDVLVLADYAIKVEKHYSKKAGYNKPMDMEWAKDAIDGELYMVQARPETVESQLSGNLLEMFHLKETGEILTTGSAVGARITSGPARLIRNVTQLNQFKPGEVLISDTTTPDWEPVMKIASAIITNRGGRTCHAAIIARELGIPAIVGCDNATQVINNEDIVTVDCSQGERGRVYAGKLAFEKEVTDLGTLARPKTKIMLNLGNPDLAFKTSFLPNDGVGLARMEFIINESIKVHPMALLHPERVRDSEQRKQVETLCLGYDNPVDYFVKHLSEGVGTIAAAFWPKPVVVRMSDFKSNEYASLIGGKYFEPSEENPMIGFRGASRYTHPKYSEAFALECAAMKRVRNDMGLTNVILMIPFCRRIEEGENVLKFMANQGLLRGENGLEIYVMCEVPNNVILIDAFAKLFDGFSIGSNDLTQLTLGVDRDSEIVAFDFDERDPGVKEMIRLAIAGAKRNNKHSGLCGQAPSDYPEIAEYLVEMGVDSMSLNPDSVLKTTRHILEVEKRINKKNLM